MIRTSALLCSTSILLSLSLSAHGQSTEEADVPGAAQREMHALQDMNNATADSLRQTNERIDMMQKYLKNKGMLEDYESGVHGDTNNDGTVDSSDLPFKLSFDKALDVAEQHEVNMAREADDESPDQLRADAYKDVVKSSWNHLHEKMAEVNSMSDYLHKKGQFDDFKDWATEQDSAAQAAMQKDAEEKSKAAVDEQNAKSAKARKELLAKKAQLKAEHQKFLQTSWDHYKFNQEEYTKRFKYANKYRNGNWNGYGGGWGYGGW